MDLLASSSGSVPAAAKRKAVRKWAGGNFGLALTMILLCRWEPLGVVAEFGNATAGRTPSPVLSLRGTRVEGSGGTRGIGKVSRLIVELGSQG